MPLRAYLTPWEATVDADGGAMWYPRIGMPGEYAADVRWSAYDLRTAEQQGQVPAQGWAVVLADVVPKDHSQIMKVPDTHEVTAGTTVAEVIAIIGDEATEHLYDPSTVESIKEWFIRVRNARGNRWQGR